MASYTQNFAANSKIVISGRGTDIGENLSAHVAREMKTIAAKYFGLPLNCSVTLFKDAKGPAFRCSVHVHRGHGMQFDGEASSNNAYTAFNAAAERVAKQLRRLKRELREDKPSPKFKEGLFLEHNRPVAFDEYPVL